MRSALWLTALVGLAAAAPPSPGPKRSPSSGSSSDPARIRRDDTETPPSDICGAIVDIVNAQESILFYASDVYECLISVPFNDAVALRYIEYYNTSIQFQSTLAYLKDPPAAYQQPAVDVEAALAEIKRNVTAGFYKNQYAFEIALQSVAYQMHDTHVDLYSGILSVFTFLSPFRLITASKDGKELPQVYLWDDLLAYQAGAQDISPISKINDQDVVEYLTEFGALQSVGLLEPHADWNALMASPAQDIQAQLDIFSGGATFYPGDELNFTFANGTVLETYWLAVYTYSYYTGPLTTGGDFYNFFVLGLLPANYYDVPWPPAYNDTGSIVDDSGDPGQTTDDDWIPYNASTAFPPNPDIVQANLALTGGGVITGYYLHDMSTAVILVPSFDELGWDIGNFSLTVDNFLEGAKAAGMTNVIIDLQDNPGGLVELAFVTFKQFFPSEKPFAGSRRRISALADALGSTFTNEYESLTSPEDTQTKYDMEASEWVITNRINAETGRNFSSWAEYAGPVQLHGDKFSLTEQYDLANIIFDEENFDGWIPTDYTQFAAKPGPTPYLPENIVILTDGICSSTCSLFVEMMTQAGVRTITMGGRPTTGPMQAASGSRGAAPYSSAELDYDIAQAFAYSNATTTALPQVRDSGVYVTYAGLNLRDQVRTTNADAPLQFTYVPADCRLFFTLDNVYNMSRQWRDVATAAFSDASLCVEGSTGAKDSSKAASGGIYQLKGDVAPPPPADERIATPTLKIQDSNMDSGTIGGGGVGGDNWASPMKDLAFAAVDPSQTPTACTPGSSARNVCGSVLPCRTIKKIPCSGTIQGTFPVTHGVCTPSCDNSGSAPCPAAFKCVYTTAANGVVSGSKTSFSIRDESLLSERAGKGLKQPPTGKSGTSSNNKLYTGYCVPRKGTVDMGCPTSD